MATEAFDPLTADDPLAALHADRAAARKADDSNADICWLATVDATGAPQVRTIVLRDVDGDLGLFVNATSPKWAQLQGDARIQISCWYPSLQRQWRIDGTVHPFPDELVARHWHRRPRISQVLDHLYGSARAQSSLLEAGADLAAELAALDAALPDRPQVPAASLALAIRPTGIECMQLHRPPSPHARCGWRRIDDSAPWESTRLVP